MEKGFLCVKGIWSGSGVKEKHNSRFVDPVTNIDCVNEGIGSPSTINVNVESSSNTPNGSVQITVHESPTTDSSVPIRSGPTSYAKLGTGEPSRKSVNTRILIAPVGNKADVAIALESIRAISEWFANTSCGFLLGKRVAYPVVANYVRNTLSKHGMVNSMLNSFNGLFFFHFSSKYRLNAMLENGPWFIHNNLLILKKWNPDVTLQKEDVGNVPVRLNFMVFPMTAFSEDGLGIIATKL
nr:hypothetical protein [Tanacetum cinerariifolium]